MITIYGSHNQDIVRWLLAKIEEINDTGEYGPFEVIFPEPYRQWADGRYYSEYAHHPDTAIGQTTILTRLLTIECIKSIKFRGSHHSPIVMPYIRRTGKP
jgi:hypothetical protein